MTCVLTMKIEFHECVIFLQYVISVQN